MKNFDMLDRITIYASAHLTDDDVNVLTLLYAPLIESTAYKMYMTLYSILNRTSLNSQALLHKELLDILGLNPKSFKDARLRLEAIGLMSTYKNENEYMFLLKSPLTAKGFLSDGVLGMYLYSLIGDTEFKRIQKLFLIPKVDKSNFIEITASFDDVFKSVEDIEIKHDAYIVNRRINNGIKIKNYDFDFNLFQTGIAQSFLEGKRITKKFESFIINMAYAYGFNEAEMQEIYNSSLNSSGHFDYMLCSKRSREKYATMHESPLPKLAVKEETIQTEEEELFQTISAKALIEAATESSVATAIDIDKVQQLYQEYSTLSRSVINVCVLYSIKKCEGTVPAYNYFDTVLKDWINKGINTFAKAQEEVSNKEKKSASKKIKKSSKPSWLNEYVDSFEEGVEDL